MKLIKLAGFASTILALAGCATHNHIVEAPFGTSNSEFIVSIDSREVAPGDKLRIFEKDCTSARIIQKERIQTCRDVELGDARVVSLIDESRALVSTRSPLSVNSKTRFEKLTN